MKSMKLSDVRLLQAKRHMKLPSPETQLRHKRQVYVGVLQADLPSVSSAWIFALIHL